MNHLNRLLTVLLRVWISRPRLRQVMIPLLALLTTASVFAPAAYADGPDDYKPGGVGDLMPSPVKPPGQGTLFESYSPDAYDLDKQLSSDLTGGDLTDYSLYYVSVGLMKIISTMGRAAVVITQWCFKVVSLPEVETAIADAIQGAAGPMMTTFLPVAVAIGVFIAWSKRTQGSPLGQLAWVAASAAIATTFLVAPTTWIKGVDNGRQLGANIAMTTLGAGLTGDDDTAMPFKTPEPAWTSNQQDNTMRRASDAVWRTYVAVPWCIADLGSIKACQKWGNEILKHGTDMDAREDYLADTLDDDTIGDEAVEWRQGHNPGGRIGVLFAGVVTAVIFCGLMLGLAFATLTSLIGALMLLVCGVAFSTLWCIPGKPRQWGVQWFEMLLGLVMVSFTATMLLGSVMLVSVSMMSLLPVYGWLAVSGLNICAAVMAFKVKGRLDGIVSAGGAQMAGRGLLGTVGRMARANRLRRALVNSRNRGGGLGDTDRRTGRDTGPASPTDRPRRRQGTRDIPPPPSQPNPSDPPTERNHERTDYQVDWPDRPQPRRPDRPNRPALPKAPFHDDTQGRRIKGEIADQKAGTPPSPPRPNQPGPRPGPSGISYPIRPGTPPRSGPPDAHRPAGRVIQGTVISNPVGAKFRSYPPPQADRRPPTEPPRSTS